jgi:hypothetical protein
MKIFLHLLLLGTVSLFTSLLLHTGATGQEQSVTFSFPNGNWEGDGCTTGGLDSGIVGDSHCFIISGNQDMNYSSSLEIPVNLKTGFEMFPKVQFEIGIRSNTMQTTVATIFWDGHALSHLNPFGSGEELKIIRCEVSTSDYDVKAGTHTIRITAEDTPNKWDFIQLDAIRLSPPSDSKLIGGELILWELFPMENGNWVGDGGTWGGLDQVASFPADRSSAIVCVGNKQYPMELEVPIILKRDYTNRKVNLTLGFRRNQRMVQTAEVYWDGKLLAVCYPFIQIDKLQGRDSILHKQIIDCINTDHIFSPGKHTLKISVKDSNPPNSMFQVDSFLLESPPEESHSMRFYLNEMTVVAPDIHEGIEKEALALFETTVNHLGSSIFSIGNSYPDGATRVLTIGTLSANPQLSQYSGQDPNRPQINDLKPFQQRESYFLDINNQDGKCRISAVGLQPLGTVYAISDLQLRLRSDGQRVYLEFPEWKEDLHSQFIFESPSLEKRGEYMNIGYNILNITPHEWTQERWHTYIDQLVLARLNRFYFYLWIDTYTMYPGSELSKSTLNRQLHENIKDMIDYAHRRGLEIVYLMCPTYFPRDIWLQHPEVHAEIEYVEHGFPAVCPNSPGAWDMMKKICRSEMEWFSKADTLQIWFYDPGGCWCEKYGCRQNQAKDLARQTKEFGDLFKELNPQANIEYNLWPIWLWEDLLKLEYRDDLNQNIKALFGINYTEITAVGAPDNEDTLPLMEKKAGFQTNVFIFWTNPENSYSFLIPHLSFLKECGQKMLKYKMDGAFGHRLEAWTRYASTFFMGQFLWNPSLDSVSIVRKFTDWKTADSANGMIFAEAILQLDNYSYHGPDQVIGERMHQLTQQVFEKIPAHLQKDIEYFPAMMEALAILGKSMNVEDNVALTALAKEFQTALNRSTTFQTIAGDAHYYFDKYRQLIGKGWKNSHY